MFCVLLDDKKNSYEIKSNSSFFECMFVLAIVRVLLRIKTVKIMIPLKKIYHILIDSVGTNPI